ncbi:MFS transporter [Brucella pituitosa]|uniref:MFS transporter n=1 Tax=Brucella pituitosa TaxID=571256 RepID=A0ABS3K0U2_9HYPH|nr:MFS transporter [Brucella pituitosa]MBO1040007.1 MFS transporter [Brucella pituitosa]
MENLLQNDIHNSSSVKDWWAVVSIASGVFSLVTAQFLPIGLMAQVASDLAVSPQEAGLLVTVPGLTSAIAAPGIILFSGKRDRRIVLWWLTALLVLSNMVIALGPRLEVVVGGGFLLGVAAGGIWAVGISMAGRLVAPPSVDRAMTIVFGGVSAGIVIGVPCGTYLGNTFGWRIAFLVTAAVAFAALLSQIALLPRLKPRTAVGLSDLSAVFRTAQARSALSAVVLLVGGQFCAYTYIVPSLEQFASAGPLAISAMLFVFGAAGFIGNFAGGAIVQRNVRRGLSQIATTIGIALLSFPFVVGNEISAFVVILVWGVAYGAVPVGLQTWVLRAAPGMTESAGSVFIGVFQSSVAVGGVLGGIAIDLYDLSATLVMGGCLALVSAVIVRTQCQPAV